MTRALTATAVALSAIWIALALVVPFARLGYPFEIEWMGGAFADHVARVLDGERIYVEPSADFVPYLYTPLYMYAAAGVSLITGEGFLPLRLTSILASIATLILLYRFVHRRTAARTPALVACGVWSACYFVVETWYDAERVDSLFLALLLGALSLLDSRRGMGPQVGESSRLATIRRPEGPSQESGRGLPGRRGSTDAQPSVAAWAAMGSAVLAATVMVLAYFTKQTALLLVPPFAVFAAIRAPRRGLVFALAFAALWFLATRGMDRLHDGWFSYYTWTLPARHEYVFPPFVAFWVTDSRSLWPLLLVTIWWFATRLRGGDARGALADGAWWGGLLLAGLASRMHVGGAVNVLMPTWLGFAIVAGLAWQHGPVGRGIVALRDDSTAAGPQREERPRPSWSARQRRRSTFGRGLGRDGRTAIAVVLVAQLAFFAVKLGNSDQPRDPGLLDVAEYLPSDADRVAGERLVQLLRDADGDVLVPFHGHLPRMAGKRGGAHAMALIDIRGSDDQELTQRVMREFWNSARARRADLVVLDENLESMGELIVPGYRFEGRLVPESESDTFMPPIGLKTRPVMLFRRVD